MRKPIKTNKDVHIKHTHISITPFQTPQITKYLCKIICILSKHTKTNLYCTKGCKWPCIICGLQSTSLCYAYCNQFKSNSLCIIHYLISYQLNIHYWVSNEKYLDLYDPATNIIRTITTGKPFDHGTESIAFGGHVFTMGGDGPSSDVFKIDIESMHRTRRQSMLTPKWAHTLCKSLGYIYSIGGYDSNKFLKDSQKYLVKSNKWIMLPPLQTERIQSASFSFNDTEIYSIGGKNKLASLNSTEKLCISNPIRWEYVKFKIPFKITDCIHGIQISYDEVLLFGGRNQGMGINRILFSMH